ncbi:hypothetical protein GCM10028773_58380 [Spirosoma koreense]
MALLKYIVIIILFLNFPLRALFHYLYDRENQVIKVDPVTNYLHMLPITNGPSSKYKSIANGIVIFQYLIVIGLLLANRDQILGLIKNWHNVP